MHFKKIKNNPVIILIGILSGLFFSVARGFGQSDWEYLFNGTDLTGWSRVNGSAHYSVLDGAIVGTTVTGSPNSFLATDRVFGDFVLELEFRQEGESNSGIQFRSLSNPDYRNGRVHGYQCEIDPSPRAWTGGIYDEARRGWLYTVDFNPPAKSLNNFGSWNHLRIEAIGHSLRTWLNGVPVAHVIDDLTAEGFIALQVHSINNPMDAGRHIFWRNIRIRTENLQTSPVDDRFIRNMIPNRVSAEESRLGWKLLWDGHSTKGWRGAHMSTFPEKGWKIENGVLMVEESGGGEARHGGDIITEKEYSAFELQMDFKMIQGANSGIKYFVTEAYGNTSGSAIGLEYQILDDRQHPDAKKGAAGNRTLASVYDMIPSYRTVSHREVPRLVGEWNHVRLVVRSDNTVQHWLNGFKVVEYERGSNLFQALVARSKYAQWENFGLAEKGHILLQDHGSEVHFRSIKIREYSEYK